MGQAVERRQLRGILLHTVSYILRPFGVLCRCYNRFVRNLFLPVIATREVVDLQKADWNNAVHLSDTVFGSEAKDPLAYCGSTRL